MFDFIKSKKGFTLVELMIVVVIMAILVAVAVPIYSVVTKNAKKKTCIGNQREIVAQITNVGMANDGMFSSGTVAIVTNEAADNYDESKLDVGTVCSVETLKSLFQKLPYCPIAGNTIYIEVTKGLNEGEIYVKTYCKDSTGTITDHEYEAD